MPRKTKKYSARQNILLATYIGLLAGLLAGLIDGLAKIIKQSYEYFEFYQSMLQSSIVMMLAFLLLGIIMHIIIRRNRSRNIMRFLTVFYPLSGIAFMSVFIIHITVKNLFFPDKTLLHPTLLIIGALITLAVATIYISLLVKRQESVKKALVKANKPVSSIAFFLCMFVLAGLVIDIVNVGNHNVESEHSTAQGPNVILLIIDTQRADHLSLYGYHRNTSPNIDRFAQDSVVFDDAVSPSSWTIPSHASIFTGRYIGEHMANTQTQFLNPDELTIAEILKDNGYYTAGFVANAYLKARYGYHQGFMTYEDRVDFFEFNVKYDSYNLMEYMKVFIPSVHKGFMRLAHSDNEMNVEEMHAKILPWIDKNHDKTFFLFINYMDVHDPYNLGMDYLHLYSNASRTRAEDVANNFNLDQGRNNPVTVEEVELLKALYDSEIRYFDHHIQELFDKLEAYGLMENTILIITGDHGEEFYEHNGWLHGQTLYEEVIHVPLIIHYPGEQGKRVQTRVNNINLFSTILEFTGIPEPNEVDSTSLTQLIIEEGTYERNYTYNSLVGRPSLGEPEFQQALTRNGWKLIRVTPDHDVVPDALLNLNKDPEEEHNLYQERPEKRTNLSKSMNKVAPKGKTYK